MTQRSAQVNDDTYSRRASAWPAMPCLECPHSSAAYRASAPRDVPVPALDAASTRTSTRDPWPPADQPSRASERTRIVPPNWTLRGFLGWPFGERRWSRSARRPYLICFFIGQRAGTRAVTWAAWRAAMTRWACGGAGHDHLRLYGGVAPPTRFGPELQVRATTRRQRRRQTRRRTRRGSARSGCNGTRRVHAGRW